MKFRSITKGATVISVVLWVCSALLLSYGSAGSFGVVGVLAVLAQVIGVQSSRREGEVENPDLVDRFVGWVGK